MKNAKNNTEGIIIHLMIEFLVIGQEYSIIALIASLSKMSIYSVVLRAVKILTSSYLL